MEAMKLLEAMGDTNVVIAGVGVAGLLPVNGPNVTFVSAYTERDGRAEKREQTFFHDKDLGWVLSKSTSRAGGFDCGQQPAIGISSRLTKGELGAHQCPTGVLLTAFQLRVPKASASNGRPDKQGGSD